MSSQNMERVVGLVLAVGLVALFMWSMHINSTARQSGDHETYEIKARFDNIGGLVTRSPVKAAGVKIGSVVSIEYDSIAYEAVVTLSIDARYDKLPIDTAASVLSSGLFGDQYIGLQPGAEAEFLIDGSEIDLTQSALVLEQIIGQFLYGKASE